LFGELEGGATLKMSRAEVFIHPLVMVNMADHHTRARVSANGATASSSTTTSTSVRALGAFMGTQEGASISILDSMEMKVDMKTLDINLALLKRKLALTHAVFPRFELLGWYLAGPMLSDAEMLTVHKQIQDMNESPLVMVMEDVGEGGAQSSAGSATGGKDSKKVLPVTVYETVMQIVNEQPVQTFVEVPVKVETTESERVTVDHVVAQRGGNSGSGGESSTLIPHMAALKNAVQMLRGRVLLVRRFLELSRSGQIPMDHDLLREAEAICNQLPALEPSTLQVDFNTQLADALLISLLAAITKETAAVSNVLDKFYLAYPTPGSTEKIEKSKSKRGLVQGKGRMN
jgi:COP9 signalosome complex subunit 6